jgi:hypothetical protein
MAKGNKKLRKKLQKAHNHTVKLLKRVDQCRWLVDEHKRDAFQPVLTDLDRINIFIVLVAEREGVELKRRDMP